MLHIHTHTITPKNTLHVCLKKKKKLSHLCANGAHAGAGVLLKKAGYALLSTKLEVEEQ